MDVFDYCLKKPEAEETYPFGEGVTVFKVGGKIFAILHAGDPTPEISLKCDPVHARILRQDHSEIVPGYHLNKDHWNTLDLRGKLPDGLVRELIDESYELVAPKKRK